MEENDTWVLRGFDTLYHWAVLKATDHCEGSSILTHTLHPRSGILAMDVWAPIGARQDIVDSHESYCNHSK